MAGAFGNRPSQIKTMKTIAKFDLSLENRMLHDTLQQISRDPSIYRERLASIERALFSRYRYMPIDQKVDHMIFSSLFLFFSNNK